MSPMSSRLPGPARCNRSSASASKRRSAKSKSKPTPSAATAAWGRFASATALIVRSQNDGYGSVILAVAQSFFDRRLVHVGDATLFDKLEAFGEEAARRWNEPDAGLWEFRTRSDIHTHSSVMCWTACDRLRRIAQHLGLPDRAKLWGERAEQYPRRNFGARMERKSKVVRCHFRWPGPRRKSAAPAGTRLGRPRGRSALPRDARRNRTRASGGRSCVQISPADDFGARNYPSSFAVSGSSKHWPASAARDEARDIFERLLAQRSSLGLLSEGIDHRTGELWGNFPQTAGRTRSCRDTPVAALGAPSELHRSPND